MHPERPLTVIKTEGEIVPESTLQEMAQFAISYFSIWKGGFIAADCYMIKGDQVSKTPESGEYLKKGAAEWRRSGQENPLAVLGEGGG